MSMPDGLTEYADAEQYDRDNSWGQSDDFYLNLAKEIGGPVLDVACGTGLLARAIAAEGVETAGVDITPQMIDLARRLSGHLDIDWYHADARTMRLGRTFRLITMNGHSFQHFLSDDDIDAFLACAREHLKPDGWLAFETRNYDAKEYGKTEEPALWRTSRDEHGREVDLLVGGVFDPETRVEVLTFIDVVKETGERNESTSTLRYVTPDHLNRMLTQHGFDIVQQYGDWSKAPLGPDQPEIITICRLA